MLVTVLASTAVMLAIAFALSLALVIANVKLAVHVDPRQAALAEALPQANCGGCGYPSCEAYAKAIHAGQVGVDRCTVGGASVAEQLADLMGVEAAVNFPFRPVIHCSARSAQRLKHGHYTGESTCAAADVVGGVQGCTFGCLGFGDCVESCEYDAMTLIDGLPRINYENCVGCGACVRACPRKIIEQIPFKVERMLVVGCANHDPGKAVRQVCQVGCIGCGVCARQTAGAVRDRRQPGQASTTTNTPARKTSPRSRKNVPWNRSCYSAALARTPGAAGRSRTGHHGWTPAAWIEANSSTGAADMDGSRGAKSGGSSDPECDELNPATKGTAKNE